VCRWGHQVALAFNEPAGALVQALSALIDCAGQVRHVPQLR
jgi:hypothetical protein